MTLGKIHTHPEAFRLFIIFYFWKFRLAHFNLVKSSLGIEIYDSGAGRNLVIGIHKKALLFGYSKIPYKVRYE